MKASTTFPSVEHLLGWCTPNKLHPKPPMYPTCIATRHERLFLLLIGVLLSSSLAGDASADDYPLSKSKYAADYTEPRSAERRYSYGTEAHQFPSPSYSEQGGSYRQPVAVELLSNSTAIIPCKLSGELFELDLQTEKLAKTGSFPNRRWSRLEVIGPDLIAVADDEQTTVVILRKNSSEDNSWEEVESFPCSSRIGDLAWSESSKTLYTTEVWGKKLRRFQLKDDAWLKLGDIRLDVTGGQMGLLESHHRVFVADNFSRRYCLVDLQTSKVAAAGDLYGHNISDVQVNSDESLLVYSSQMLNEFIETKRGEIVWGGLLSNNLRQLNVQTLLTTEGSQIFSGSRFIPVGDVGNGAGDPMAFCFAPADTADQQIAVALGGTNRLALTRIEQHQLQKVDVGIHPVDCQFTPDGERIIVVNQFEDTLAIVDLSAGLSNRRVRRLSLGPLRKPTQVERGEQLFFNSRLSHDGWMSCNSCHGQGHTNSQLNDNTTDGSFGSPKRVLSLLGNTGTAPFGWNGRFEKLEGQVEHSLRSTMACDLPVTEEMVADLTAFVSSLQLPKTRPSLAQASNTQAHPGKEHFKRFGCSDCHNPKQQFTSADTYDVGLIDEQDLREFNPPSLLGLSLRQESLLHDGRADSIRNLLLQHKHQLPASAKNSEIAELVDYLETF